MLYFTTDQIAVLEKSQKQEDFKQYLKKLKYVSPSIVMVIKNAYTFATMRSMSIEQKQAMLNIILELVYEIPKLSTIKSDFFHSYGSKIDQLAKRSVQNLTPKFTAGETAEIKTFFQQEVIPYYELFEFVFDYNPEFDFVSEVYDPVPTTKEFRIFEGQIVQPETIEVLKEFVGQRAPKQEKKDPKKK